MREDDFVVLKLNEFKGLQLVWVDDSDTTSPFVLACFWETYSLVIHLGKLPIACLGCYILP
jgi:hypothetical protein